MAKAKVEEIGIEVPPVDNLGQGNKLKSRQSLQLTRELAKTILGYAILPGERPISEGLSERYASEMNKGKFNWSLVHIAIAYCKEDGNTYRINGGHTCTAVQMAKLSDTAEKVDVLTYICETKEDVRLVYGTFDQGRPRSKNHVAEVVLTGIPEFGKISKVVLKFLINGCQVWKFPTKDERTAHAGNDVASLLVQVDKSLALKVARLLGDLDPVQDRHVFRAPTVAAMFATIAVEKEAGEKFWYPIAKGTRMNRADDPRLCLRDKLKSCSIGSGETRVRKSMSREAMYRGCIICWNAYVRNEALPVLRVVDTGPRPEVASFK